MPPRLGDTTWTALDAPFIVVPLGSCEQHGPHLPLATDTMIASALTDVLCKRAANCFAAPPITIAASGEHAGFPGTLSIGTAVATQVLVEVGRSADWSAGVVFVNGHGGNASALRDAVDALQREGRNVLGWSPRFAGGDLHAGHLETSIMLHLHPDVVLFEQAVPGPAPAISDLIRSGVKALSPSGVLGDPTNASAAVGAELFGLFSDQLTEAFGSWQDAGTRR